MRGTPDVAYSMHVACLHSTAGRHVIYDVWFRHVAHLIVYHLLEPSWHSWTAAWLLMPLLYYAIIPDELHWLLDLAVRLACCLYFTIQKQSAGSKRALVAPGVYSHEPGTHDPGQLQCNIGSCL